MIQNLTAKLQDAISRAQQHALLRDCPTIEPIHILMSLIENDDGGCLTLLSLTNADVAAITQGGIALMEQCPQSTDHNGEVNFGRDSIRILNLAYKESQALGDTHIATDLMLMTLVEKNKPIQNLFQQSGVSAKDLKAAILKNRRGKKVESENAEGSFNALEKYTLNITRQAREGKLDPVIGRDEEIRRTLHVLQRRTKNNPVIIGDPGVGKTAIVEGLAQRLVNKEAPEDIYNKEILALDLGMLLAGAKFRGEFEERLKSVIKEITERGDVIVFIDELHTLVGAGASEGSVDAANLLKPALARGELHCIGATTLDEYRRYIEKDSALERRFQKIMVPEPSIESSIAILRGLGSRYEAHHGVRITDPAIVAAVELSARYIADRFLPDKAIDLIDEAAARLKMEASSKPENLDRLSRRLVQIRIEQEALIRNNDTVSQKRLKDIRKEISNLEREVADLEEVWQLERQQVESSKHNQNERERLINEMARVERKRDWQRLSEIQHGDLPAIDKKITEDKARQFKLLKTEIGANEIAEIVSASTGIPISSLMDDERSKLLAIEEKLRQRVVGQEEAVTAIANAVRRARAGVIDENRPLGTFLFLGPTGVGKTELCKALAELLFNSEAHIKRIDMSEYMEKHSVARLIGAPPGYVGFEEGGQLTEAIRRRPFSIILLDEIEKAHPDIFNVLLQVFDDGRMTDGRGRTVDFKNTIIIMTSNLASGRIQQASKQGSLRDVYNDIIDEVRQFFRPEFFNRIDDSIIFNPLRAEDMEHIVNIQMKRITNRLAKKELYLTVSPVICQQMAKEGFVPELGARPLKRLIQKRIENPLSEWILRQNPLVGSEVLMDNKGQFKQTKVVVDASHE